MSNRPTMNTISFSFTFMVFLFVFFLLSPVAVVVFGYGDQSTVKVNSFNNYSNYSQIQLPQHLLGPEGLAFDCNGEGPYTGVSDGRIFKWQGPEEGWKEFATTAPNRPRGICDGSTNTDLEPTCGRPLELKFNPVTCDLYIADAYFGLMVVGPNGGKAQSLASSAEGIPFRFTNALDIDPNTGLVYFTDTSMYFQRRQFSLSILSGDKSGRLMKYNPKNKTVTVMCRGLAFPNGVALSKDYSFLILAESTPLQILRFGLQGDEAGYYTAPQLFAQLQRFPDNIKRNDKGEFWVALNTPREATPYDDTKDIVGIKFDELGSVVKMIEGDGGNALVSVSEVQERGEYLYLGSPVVPYVGVLKI